MLDQVARLIPFSSHDDITRIQLGCTQTRQAIPIIHSEIPYIRTGFEEENLEYSSYLFRAKDNGIVTYMDNILMICKYTNGHGEIIELGSEYANREGFDKQLHTKLKLGDKFKKDDILAYHSTITEDGFLNLGCNLKTTYISCPYNYKDALVVSESCAKKMATKIIHEEVLECTDTIPILWKDNNISYPQGTYVEKAKPIFIVKERTPLNPMHVISKGEEILAPVSGKLYYKLKIDEIVKTQTESDFYEEMYKNEIAKEELISEKIKEIYDMGDLEDSCEANSYINYYCPQLNKRRTGKSIILTYWIVEEVPLMVGCKLSNRHGNKGVIAAIYKDEDMPKDQYGEYADIIVNSMCITSRMNVGQLFELHMNRANHLYCKKHLHDIIYKANSHYKEYEYEGFDLNDKLINEIFKMLKDAQPNYINKVFEDWFDNANTDDKINFVDSVLEKDIVQIVHPPFTKFTYDDCFDFCKKYGRMDDDLKEPILFNGEEMRASFGHTYWYRLEHEPYKKYFARSVGLYGKIGQPSRNNGSNKGAHRLGEMETWALLANQAYENLLEMFVSKSDSISEAARLLKYLYDDCSSRYTPFEQTPGILHVFSTFVEASGYHMKNVQLDENGNIIDFDFDDENSTPQLPALHIHNQPEYIDIDINEELSMLEDKEEN